MFNRLDMLSGLQCSHIVRHFKHVIDVIRSQINEIVLFTKKPLFAGGNPQLVKYLA